MPVLQLEAAGDFVSKQRLPVIFPELQGAKPKGSNGLKGILPQMELKGGEASLHRAYMHLICS